MSNSINKNRYAGGNQDILDDPEVIELLSKYTEEIRKRQINPEEFINDNHYNGTARREILREMRFAAALEIIYANERRKNAQMFTSRQIRQIIAKVTKTVISRLRAEKSQIQMR